MKKITTVLLSFILIMAIALPAAAFKAVPVKGIKLDKSKITLNIGKTHQLKVTFTPANTTQKTLTFVTGNNKVAVIDAKGKIKGVGKGTTKITVYAYNKKISANCTVTINAPETKAVQKKPVKIIWASPTVSNVEDDARVKKYIEEKSGVKFEAVIIKNTADFATQVNVYLASNADIDVINRAAPGGTVYQDFVESNKIQKINESLQKYGPNLMKNIAPEAWKAVTDQNNNIYGIPTQNQLFGNLIAVRKDWREKLGMGSITTLAELEKYLVAVRDGDLDGNKVKDTIPLSCYNKKYYELEISLLYCFLETECGDNGAFLDYLDDNGNIVPVYMHPKYKDYLAMMAKWTKEGLLHKDIPTITKNQLDDLIGANRIGAVAEWYSSTFTPLDTLMKTVPEGDYEFVTPKTISGKKYKLQVNAGSTPLLLFVSYSKNVDWAIKLFDWMLASQENYWTIKGGVKGTDWEVADASKNKLNKLKAIEKSEEGYNSRYGMLFYSPWDIEFEQVTNRLKKMYAARRWYNEYNSYNLTPDWFITYNLNGTPLESSKVDAKTLIDESKVRIILGQLPVDEWDKVIEQYKKIFGDEFVKKATIQYKAYNKK